MGRPRLPTNVHKLKGTGKVHPERMREREGEPEDNRELGEPPEWLGEDGKQAWREIVDNAIPGVLKKADGTAVSLAADSLAKVWAGSASTAEKGLLVKLLSQFGMTPADRSKINMGKSGESNPFADE